MKYVNALLVDTTSIQSYIFGSNKLKANIGASHIVSELYENEQIKDCLEKILGRKVDLESWKNNKTISIFQTDVRFEVGYIGGGNALFFFSEDTLDKAKELAKSFVKSWSKSLLKDAPGINLAVAYKDVEAKETLTDLEKFTKFKNDLYECLNEYKQNYSPINTFLHLGITAPCNYTDLTSNIFYEDPNDEKKSNFVSLNAFQKLENSPKANKRLTDDLTDILGDKYTFDTNQEKLGQKENEKNYLAIVHIDGNGIGKLFEECENLLKTRELSCRLEENIKASFKQLVSELVSKKLEQYEELYIQREKDRFILPLRPIVMSGDDITFVCEGRLGIYLAKKWVEILINKPVLGKKVSYCAGVCVANTNFPFQRAYKLAEEACKNAKIKVRDLQRKDENIIKEELNWIDFHIQYGGYGGELVELRKQFFAMGGNLIARPYQIGGNESNSLHTLIEDTTVLKESPTSIQHELREVLWKNQSDRNNYLQFNKTRKSSIDFEHFKFNKKYDPNSLFKNDSADNIDENNDNKTHFFDMIELAEFYPWFLESGK